jgi:hypothetical protein
MGLREDNRTERDLDSVEHNEDNIDFPSKVGNSTRGNHDREESEGPLGHNRQRGVDMTELQRRKFWRVHPNDTVPA